MSSASRNSYLHRRNDSNRGNTLKRAPSRSQTHVISHDDAYSFALRIAYLNYLLQPKTKRKQWVAAPKPIHKAGQRSHTAVGDLISQLSSPSGSSKITMPHGFRSSLEKRLSQVVQGSYPVPGYNDAAVKRSFARAYTAFTEKAFQKRADDERKIDPYILMFYSSATKAANATAVQANSSEDHVKMLPDRHLALFVRLVSHMLRDQGVDRDRPELMKRLDSLEKKLLTHDQNLADVNNQNETKMIEVIVPLSYDVKDMPLVLLIQRVFGRTKTDVQSDIDAHRHAWTEEAALKDIKAYQHRLASNAPGSLRKHDFDTDEAYEEWKKAEATHLSEILFKITTAKPELLKTSSSSLDKPLPGRPMSLYGEDQAYGDLSRALSNPDSATYGSDPSSMISLSSLSLEDAPGGTQTVEEPAYTFIPPNPRSFYKAFLQYCMTYDHLHSDPALPYAPFSPQSIDLLIELSVFWRLPQFTRLIVVIEVASKRFLDGEIDIDQLAETLEIVKETASDHRKAPALQHYPAGLSQIDRQLWTVQDFIVYQQTLQTIHDALLRDLFNQLKECYGQSPPNIASIMKILEDHIEEDPAFAPKQDQLSDFSKQVTEALRQSARDLYHEIVQTKLPEDAESWQFSHVIEMGKLVVQRVAKMQKRYRSMSEIKGVTPLPILVQTILPIFEQDAEHIIGKAIQTAQAAGCELDIDDGFDLYRELIKLRESHYKYLPGVEFHFDIEGLLQEFVWRWIREAESRMEAGVINAIKLDDFRALGDDGERLPSDAERHSASIADLFQFFSAPVTQIDQLEWRNEEHHARFMTALAHTFATGIEKYCEEVGRIFAADMERLTPQEEAMASRTTQERFMQYAKEAWNNKEKPEPYNFSSKAFVMLNNIEFAKQKLDKLEHTMNVDRCAEIVRAIDGPKQQTRRPNKYNFTVKIVEAEDLKACDPNGFSDPYVVLVDERQKRLHKTRVVRKSLNPRWDESRDITVTAPITIIATVWDDDMFGDHDFVGRTSFKLDPVHFSDYIPREIWLDLDTQGRILVKISMEGERDDIEFQFGKAFRDLKRTEQIMVRKITEKLRDQINTSLSHETLRRLLGGAGLGAQVTSLWKKRTSIMPTAPSKAVIDESLDPLMDYFHANFTIMNQTLTNDTMRSVMLRLWKEVLLAVEALLVPPLSDKPSEQRPLSRLEVDIVYGWLRQLLAFFNAKDEEGNELGVPENDLRSPKWHELASLNFFYFEDTVTLVRESERMAASNAQKVQKALAQQAGAAPNRLSAPPVMGAPSVAAFGSMGTIKRGKSIMMSRNLGTMRRAKEEKWKEDQAEPSDDMIMRILRMRPEAANYLKERSRQKERQSARTAAMMIVNNSVSQGWAAGGAGGAPYARNNLPRR
ncbi:C2 domain-containing protein [Verticillium dahliae VdLs.17]|uniref:C2 domain-containing protein n=1 Tax=Verticillium dahliae (strain VdLs.17 / ATCC MYA-4575 / FGSC 10137) TaxID=498257 RepID=G2X2U3_VERDV|nr:C2 domain-containing protein [Verticillium dahliae VdLs.17]EGY22699.1 C2 domain-containing protein [Verticillium dahliae VdLs.17]